MFHIQRSFLLLLSSAIGGSALIAPAAFAQTQPGFASVSAANWGPIVAPDSIAAGFGNAFSLTTTSANAFPLPVTLSGAQVVIKDSAGNSVTAPLFMVAAGQINYLVPASVAVGKATVTTTTNGSSGTSATTYSGTLLVSTVAPAIFAADNSGSGPPAAQVIRVSGGVNSSDPAPYTLGTNGSPASPSPIRLSPFTDSIYLVLYGTGIRRHSANPVTAAIGGTSVPVQYVGAQGTYSGLDQINVGPLPSSLANKGTADLVINVDGIPVNTTKLNIQ